MTSDSTAVEAIAALARQGNEPEELELGSFYIIHRGDGGIEEVDLTGDRYRDNPRQLKGHVQLTDVDSLLTYWDKHNDPDSDMFADRDRRTITAVIDANHGRVASPADPEGNFLGIAWADDERARFQHHRATVTLATSEPWQAWTARNGKPFTQEEFAEFIEDHIVEIIDPDSATLVEMAQTFQATTSANFKSGYKLNNGQRVLSYVENIEGRMSDGQATVPTGLVLRLPIWRGSRDAIELTARLRYRLSGSRLAFSYHLDRAVETIDAAFEREVARVQEHIARPVLRGTPA